MQLLHCRRASAAERCRHTAQQLQTLPPRSHSTSCAALGRRSGSIWVQVAKMWRASCGAVGGMAKAGRAALPPPSSLPCGRVGWGGEGRRDECAARARTAAQQAKQATQVNSGAPQPTCGKAHQASRPLPPPPLQSCSLEPHPAAAQAAERQRRIASDVLAAGNLPDQHAVAPDVGLVD